MNKVEEYIKKNTRRSQEGDRPYNEWISVDCAKEAVEIAREEIIEKACDAYCKVCGHYPHTTPKHICRKACDYYMNFKQAIKDE